MCSGWDDIACAAVGLYQDMCCLIVLSPFLLIKGYRPMSFSRVTSCLPCFDVDVVRTATSPAPVGWSMSAMGRATRVALGLLQVAALSRPLHSVCHRMDGAKCACFFFAVYRVGEHLLLNSKEACFFLDATHHKFGVGHLHPSSTPTVCRLLHELHTDCR